MAWQYKVTVQIHRLVSWHWPFLGSLKTVFLEVAVPFAVIFRIRNWSNWSTWYWVWITAYYQAQVWNPYVKASLLPLHHYTSKMNLQLRHSPVRPSTCCAARKRAQRQGARWWGPGKIRQHQQIRPQGTDSAYPGSQRDQCRSVSIVSSESLLPCPSLRGIYSTEIKIAKWKILVKISQTPQRSASSAQRTHSWCSVAAHVPLPASNTPAVHKESKQPQFCQFSTAFHSHSLGVFKMNLQHFHGRVVSPPDIQAVTGQWTTGSKFTSRLSGLSRPPISHPWCVRLDSLLQKPKPPQCPQLVLKMLKALLVVTRSLRFGGIKL